jgi:hypothetical protein
MLILLMNFGSNCKFIWIVIMLPIHGRRRIDIDCCKQRQGYRKVASLDEQGC